MPTSRLIRSSAVLIALVVLALSPTLASANHSWNGYHWARTKNPFTLKLGNNLSSVWQPYLSTTSSDWSQSSVLDTTIVGGQSTRRCRATSGRVEVCNAAYGSTGWLGLASISINGPHITAGTVKLNDTYFNTAQYNTPAYRNQVMCQEVGHTLGLTHQDENFDNPNLGTCMDYTSDPSSNQHPNQHDYDQLVSIYSHLDSSTTVGARVSSELTNSNFDSPDQWGQLVRQSAQGKPALYVRDFGGGNKVFTFVLYAP